MEKKLYGDGRKSFSILQKIDMRLWFFKPSILFSKAAKIFIQRNFLGENPSTDFDKYAGRPFKTLREGGDYIGACIDSGNPRCIGRFGDTELFACCDWDVRHKMADQNFYRLQVNSGYFYEENTDEEKFYQIYLDAFKNSDALGCWFTIGEDYMIKKYNTTLELMPLCSYEPWHSDKTPWSAHLAGKKVLVISPFTNTIEQQYKKREKLFEGTDILPEFDLITYRSVNTRGKAIDSRFDNWFDALEFMKKEISQIDFDVAIAGCGAYTLPLCSYIKDMGKIAIQMGGATQLLFGIIGNRWENDPVVKKYVNDSWTRLLPSDITEGTDIADKPYA